MEEKLTFVLWKFRELVSIRKHLENSIFALSETDWLFLSIKITCLNVRQGVE